MLAHFILMITIMKIWTLFLNIISSIKHMVPVDILMQFVLANHWELRLNTYFKEYHLSQTRVVGRERY
jgi:hypothetical protein